MPRSRPAPAGSSRSGKPDLESADIGAGQGGDLAFPGDPAHLVAVQDVEVAGGRVLGDGYWFLEKRLVALAVPATQLELPARVLTFRP